MVNYSGSQNEQADIAQSVVRRIGSAEVTGPIPVISLGAGFILSLFVYIYAGNRIHPVPLLCFFWCAPFEGIYILNRKGSMI